MTPAERAKRWEAERRAKGYVKRQVLLDPATARRADDLCARWDLTLTELIVHLLNLPEG